LNRLGRERGMTRKIWFVLCLVVVLVFGAALAAGAQQQKLGLIFNLWDFGDVSSADGLSSGLGIKYWLGDNMAIRGLLDFLYDRNSAADTTDTFFGLSGAFEYHFVSGRVSPYAGGLVSVRIQGGDVSNLGLLLGGLFGVELRVMDVLGLFGEYQLGLFADEPITQIFLRAGNNAAFGVVVYLPKGK
jgi:hypothetical protein